MADNKYKLLVVDIDGTLLDRNRAISDEDKEALARVTESGIRVSLSTGRVVEASRKILDRLSLDGYHMFFDGALVYNPVKGEEVYADPINRETLKQLVDFAHRIGLDMDLYSSTHYFVERETWATDIRRDFFDLLPVVVDFKKFWREERIIKGTLVVASPEDKAKAEQIFKKFQGRLNFSWTRTPAYPDIDFINVIAPDVSKGTALQALVNFLGITLEEVMAIGDGANDISLLSAAGLAVAVDNAADELKAVADHITLDVDHHGVADAVSRFLL